MPRGRLRWLVAGLLAMALVAAACGGDEEAEPTAPSPQATETETTAPTPTETEPAVPEFTTLTPGILTVASCFDFPPFEFVEGDEVMGFEPELVMEMASRLGVEIEWVTTDFDTIFTNVAADQFDMVMAASTITDERSEIVNFSDPYFEEVLGFAVNAERTPDIQSSSDLSEGDVVAVQRGTTGQAWAQENLEPNGIVLRTFALTTPMLAALEAGNVVGILQDAPGLQGVIDEQELTGIVEVAEEINTGAVYGFAFSQSNPGLLDAINATLADMVADGTAAATFEKWFPGVAVPPPLQA